MVSPLNTTSTGTGEPSGRTTGGASVVDVVASRAGEVAVVDTEVGDPPVVVLVGAAPWAAAGEVESESVGVLELPLVTSTTSSAVAPTATAPQTMPAVRRR